MSLRCLWLRVWKEWGIQYNPRKGCSMPIDLHISTICNRNCRFSIILSFRHYTAKCPFCVFWHFDIPLKLYCKFIFYELDVFMLQPCRHRKKIVKSWPTKSPCRIRMPPKSQKKFWFCKFCLRIFVVFVIEKHFSAK